MAGESALLLDTSGTTSFKDDMTSATGFDNLQLVTSLSMADGKHNNAAEISNSADDILVASSSMDATGSFEVSSAVHSLTLQTSASSGSGGKLVSSATSQVTQSSANIGSSNASNSKMGWVYSSFIIASFILGCI